MLFTIIIALLRSAALRRRCCCRRRSLLGLFAIDRRRRRRAAVGIKRYEGEKDRRRRRRNGWKRGKFVREWGISNETAKQQSVGRSFRSRGMRSVRSGVRCACESSGARCSDASLRPGLGSAGYENCEPGQEMYGLTYTSGSSTSARRRHRCVYTEHRARLCRFGPAYNSKASADKGATNQTTPTLGQGTASHQRESFFRSKLASTLRRCPDQPASHPRTPRRRYLGTRHGLAALA